MRFTLDTNCIIDVEDERPNALFVRELVTLQGVNGTNVAVSSIGASERKRAGGYAKNFLEFKEKLAIVGFGALELLPPLGYWDLCFWDHCVWADENDTLERDIHDGLMPVMPEFFAHSGAGSGIYEQERGEIRNRHSCHDSEVIDDVRMGEWLSPPGSGTLWSGERQ